MLFFFLKRASHLRVKISNKSFYLFWSESSLLDYFILLVFERLFVLIFLSSVLPLFVLTLGESPSTYIGYFDLSYFCNNLFTYFNFGLFPATAFVLSATGFIAIATLAIAI